MKKHIRDTETGEFISEEEAKTRHKGSYVVDTDFDKGKFLEKIFEELKEKVSRTTDIKNTRFYTTDEILILSLEEIKEVFNKHGAKLKS